MSRAMASMALWRHAVGVPAKPCWLSALPALRAGGPPPPWRWPAAVHFAAVFTSGQVDLDRGMKASSPGSVATSL